MTLNIDNILEAIGEFGPYQRRVYFLLCLPIIFVGAINLSYVFIAAEPRYRCIIESCDNATSPQYKEPFLEFTTPFNNESNHFEYCYQYGRRNGTVRDTCNEEDFLNITYQCQDGIVFDKTIYENTIVSEFNLTCQSSMAVSGAQAVFFVGILVGSFLFGIISDLIGRRKTILISIVGMTSSGVTVALVPNLTSFNVLRFFNAFCSAGVFQTSFILGMEFVGPSKRVMFGVVGEYFFAAGEILLGLIAWAIPKWRMLQLVISAPIICFIFYYWVIPESVRWLQAKGEHSKVLTSLEKIAKVNKKSIPLHLLRHQTEEESDNLDSIEPIISRQQKVTVLDILKSWRMAMRTFLMIIIWIITTLVYYGLSYKSVVIDVGSPTSAPFIDFILCSVVEIPGYTFAWLGMAYWGRRGSLILSLLIAGGSCIGSEAFDDKEKAGILVCFLLGKCAITCAFAIVYVFTAELFPTKVRNTIIGVCSMFARIGGIVAPFSLDLKYLYPGLPMYIFGGLSTVGGFCTVFMPETLNTRLPDTIAEALALGRGASLADVSDRSSAEERENLLDNQSEESDGEEGGAFNPSS